ncbi:chorismate-binding protein [Pandoraea pulmonicola]|uniref:Aminodeoxychorismate synthase component I n=1 Tax=Pandoraea pulmonicola TaxID=93221 RepID=A0AAJ4ZEW7_PANPU|nr:bifunctional anthranilate synthase component I family protein/class IV aminotransferase [Pandoraea pulmonicola]AJC19782.1 aminodeoxychorismate synthase component I [Pandoraea pulmonicola]SUA92065.1 Para-aminobenzoate synthase component 1 [Pandoraea pulmonicola]
MSSEAPVAAFALLDDSADPAGGARLYTGLVREVTCDEPGVLSDALREMEDATRRGLHAVLLADYEFGVRLGGVHTTATRRAPGQFRALLFRDLQRLDAMQTQTWLAAYEAAQPSDGAAPAPVVAPSAISGPQTAIDTNTPPGVAGVAALHSDVSDEAFDDAISRIHDWLSQGECYQINYTYRLNFDAFGSPAALYRRLRARQPVPYGALVVLPGARGVAGRAILSLSPELFLRHSGGRIEARPMKGTAPASADAAIDTERSAALAADEKNRAENLMIVDLLRNDLGRLATPGTVSVPKLFEVTRFSSVLQMTSTVTATLPPTTTFADVLRALYPCGSITGAPKHRTMQLIGELESSPRGLYTGAIGWLDPRRDDPHALGDFCLSVAIRTLELEAPDVDGVRRGRLGVGAGIVLDSKASEEREECRLKARFLSALDPGFELFETMRAARGGGVAHVERHLARLAASAAYFGFRFDAQALRTQLDAVVASFVDDASHRVRLALSHGGTVAITHAPLTPLPAGTVNVMLADDASATRANDLFLRHKTTVRARYDAAWREAEANGAFDTLFFNERGELTEGGRSNVFVKRDGVWVTPQLSSGVLPGVMRGVMLADPAWAAVEGVITREELLAAREIVVCNALRGALPAKLLMASPV